MPVDARARILAVEDDPIVRADLRLILEDAGFDVSEARDGIEAVEHARDRRPDLILLDLGLPRLDGLEAARRILSERVVPIVALTGRSNLDGRRRAAGAGATDLVLKPFDEQELVRKLRGALERDEREDQHLHVMIEAMVRDGYSRHEIENAVRLATGQPLQPAATAAIRALGRMVGRLRR
jgi:DNA-binding response OmpR family regulator